MSFGPILEAKKSCVVIQDKSHNVNIIVFDYTGCFIPSVNYQHQVFSAIHGAILKPFDMVIVHMVRFDIMYGNP